MLLVLTTMPDSGSADALARELVEKRLAACVNIMPGTRSVYRWQDAIEEACEVVLHIKTSQARYAELEIAIKALHPYDVPEIIALPIVEGLPAYLEWVAAETNRNMHV